MAKKPSLTRHTPAWAGALGHLEQNHPEELARLLRAGTLAEHLDNRARAWWIMENRLEKQLPNANLQERREIVNSEMFPVNPKADEERPLNREEERLLEQFREEHEI